MLLSSFRHSDGSRQQKYNRRPRLLPVIPIQTPILHRLRQMLRGHHLHPGSKSARESSARLSKSGHAPEPMSPSRRAAISSVRSPASSSAVSFRSAFGGICAL